MNIDEINIKVDRLVKATVRFDGGCPAEVVQALILAQIMVDLHELVIRLESR